MKIRIILTKNQWERISEIFGNGGLLVFGSVVIPFFLDKVDIPKVIWGMAVSIYLWYISIKTARKY